MEHFPSSPRPRTFQETNTKFLVDELSITTNDPWLTHRAGDSDNGGTDDNRAVANRHNDTNGDREDG
jgi:hypothetical protein